MTGAQVLAYVGGIVWLAVFLYAMFNGWGFDHLKNERHRSKGLRED